MKNKPFDLPVMVITSGGKRLAAQLIRSSAYVQVIEKLDALGISNNADTDHIVSVEIVIPHIYKSNKPQFSNYYKFEAIVSVEITLTDIG